MVAALQGNNSLEAKFIADQPLWFTGEYKNETKANVMLKSYQPESLPTSHSTPSIRSQKRNAKRSLSSRIKSNSLLLTRNAQYRKSNRM